MIDFRYEEKKYHTIVFANDAQIGTLFPFNDFMSWSPNDMFRNVRFQFRKEEIFLEVVKELKRYTKEQGCKYLVVSRSNNGYVTQLGEEMVQRAGFRNLPNNNPDFFFLD